MKRAIKIMLLIPILLIVLALVVLCIKYSPSYVYRLITQNVADVYDYQKYENRVINGSEDTFQFEKELDESYVESLFQDRVLGSGFKTFDEWAKKSQTTALIFIRKDTILYEKYFNGFESNSYFHSQSMAKSFISFLIGAAIDEGLISGVNDPMTLYIPELKERDPDFEKITIKNLLEMRSGLKYVTGYFPGTYIHLPWHAEAVGYYHPNVRKLLLKKVDIAREPGKTFEYNNYNTSYLGLIIERATNKTVSEYLEDKLWSQIMTQDALFSVDSKKSGFEYMPSRLIARANDYARFGRLFLYEGNWNGKQIISKDWVVKSTRENKSIPREIYPDWLGGDNCNHTYYSYQWWGNTNCDSTFEFFANGNLGQQIYVIPDKEIIIVHCGNSLEYYGESDLMHAADCIRFNDFHQSITNIGVDETIKQYREKKKQFPSYQAFDEQFLIGKGYAFLNAGKIEDAQKIFALNIDTYPDSWTVYNNMGEAFQRGGEIDSAKFYYNKSLRMNPENNWATEKLEMLK
ncbi:serine hydrolase [uncultured Draconibacterium sp.]|uniref:serine hydrolase n=1 Tax=uncultured Draconibacterium sp. TaxID=1573823 RepID=UPI0029C9784E|nr:serine hydrolase [uncultured Draconibacterium sp.]